MNENHRTVQERIARLERDIVDYVTALSNYLPELHQRLEQGGTMPPAEAIFLLALKEELERSKAEIDDLICLHLGLGGSMS